MKNLSGKIIPVILCMAAILLGSCQDDEMDSPPLNEADGIITIAELRTLFTGQALRFDQDIMLYATVTMDESSGNIYRNIFIQDESAGLNVRMDYATEIVSGERVRVSLKGTVLDSYNNMLQLDSVEYGKNLIKQGEHVVVEPVTVSIPEILSGGYQAMLVKLDSVQFSAQESGQRYANVIDGLSENRTLTDCSNNRIIVRTSPFADFANHLIPNGNGSMTAIVSQFGNTWQLFIRDISEVNLTGDRCDAGEPRGSGTFDDPYNVAHAIQFNSGSDVWVEGYIVGVMEPAGNTNQPSFNPPFQTVSNIIIADRADDTDNSRIMPVQLPPGQIRNALNLVANPQNKGKIVKIKGNLAAYFIPRPGLREASGYWLDGQGIGDGGIWDLLNPVSVSELRESFAGSGFTIPGNTMISGIVISDRENENITGRNLHLVDEDDGAGIVLRFATFHNFEMGSRIRIDVSGIGVSRFNGLMQIADIPNSQAELMETGVAITPETTTIKNILDNMHYFESRLVKINNVRISGGNTWRGSNGSLTLNDGTANITHFTTSYSAFAGSAVPQGPVTLSAIVSVFNNPQVYIRNLNDIETP